jgi:caffeoyl-CoA O-methyltransferase
MLDNLSKIMDYAFLHTSAEDEILNQLYRETNLKTVYPRMISGHMQGKFLEFVSHMIRPSGILEIGTFTGYSAICLARGLADGGLLHTIDVNDELEELALKYFKLANLQDKIILHNGDARDVIPAIEGLFDLVFIDGDKEQYLQYYELVFHKLRRGGFMLADNVLWSGKVLPDCLDHDKETRGIRDFNSFIAADSRVEKLLLPFRDGIYILHKITD